LPFARWVALRDVTFMKRFVVDEVFVRPSQQRTTLGGQPLSKTQGSFDIVLPLSYLSSASEIHKLHEEVLECAQRCLNSCGITSDRIIVKIGDISQQRNAFELCGILDTRQQMQVRNILVNQDIRSNWKPLRRKLLQVISPKQSDSLRRCIQPEIDTRFDLFLHPVEDFETSFFFKIFVLDNNESHRPWLAGEGGRYDNLISEFHSHHITNNLVVAVGLRLHLTTIAGYMDTETSTAMVLLCSPSDNHVTVELKQIKDLAATLRAHNISVETLYPPEASTEALLNFCKERNISYMVTPRGTTCRILDCNSGKHIREFKESDLINFLTKGNT